VNRCLKNMAKQKDGRVNQETLRGSSPSKPWYEGKVMAPPQ
jgi:hypothetical protein